MKKNHIINFCLMAFAVTSVAVLSNCNSPAPESKTAKEEIAAQPPEVSQVDRGKQLVTICGCNDCHSPKIMTAEGPIPDTTKLLSGHPAAGKLPDYDKSMTAPGKWVLVSQDLTAWVGPWGISYPVNLTPDTATGTGAWTPELFIQIIRSGHFMGAPAARPLLPPMPWFNYATMSDDELKSIFAYLHSLPAISNRVPDAVLAAHP